MRIWKEALIGPEMSLRTALETINRAGSQIVLVVDQQRRLLGTLSDGDARRALLRGLSLADPVSAAMHITPTCASTDDDRATRLSMMRRLGVHQLPVLDGAGLVVGLETVDDFLGPQEREHSVVIMAGGLGSRLKELTQDTPKPMLQVGSRPLLETIMRGYADQGFRNFYLAVNYKAEQIEQHFGDGAQLGIRIHYLRERQRLGTAGALSLLPELPTQPILVTNADLLTKENYGAMLDQHLEAEADATMGVREYEMQVPFGVVRERNGRIESIEEKPIQRFTVSSGMYVLSPSALALVPPDQFFDMPSLFEAVVAKGMHTRCHRINGYWLDIGRLPDYTRANQEFDEVFR
ncbi:nucleotidyltransferase family protein [Janthinobacterium fluminis]|uniref:Nucleotidyltransferase family protein n=1 Tax=Janthinobacterium fluminis TaxID=2987524 RepID=A0ABT5K1T1_9BURK|nr:nucleotidyltransferase family protein [Janthinobacterium fluminis]MDC8758884.1 nucleotidyltransferase family protein [Janthinobacterium fluminis]